MEKCVPATAVAMASLRQNTGREKRTVMNSSYPDRRNDLDEEDQLYIYTEYKLQTTPPSHGSQVALAVFQSMFLPSHQKRTKTLRPVPCNPLLRY